MSATKYPAAAVRANTDLAKETIGKVIAGFFKAKFDVEFNAADITKDLARPKSAEHGDFVLACHSFMRLLKPQAASIKEEFQFDVNPNNLANFVAEGLKTMPATQGLTINGATVIQTVATSGAFVNISFTPEFHAQLVWSTVLGDFVQPAKIPGMDTVMIEYSQPNTHKAFHVGHMRNAALGDSLVRLYEQAGHKVIAVNYFGDEGAHVAKCLWYLQKIYMPLAQKAAAEGKSYDPTDKTSVYPMKSIDDLESIPVPARAEWLGDLYTKAVDLLDISTYTSMPWPMVIAAKVIAKGPHPDPEAPANWHLCTVETDEAGSTATVVCGGTGYEVGDYVAYLPVGAKLTKKMGIIAPKDMRGVASSGVMLAESELGGSAGDDDDAAEPAEGATPAPAAKKGGSKKGASASAAAVAAKQIKLLDKSVAKAGVSLAELGRKDTVPEVKTVMEVFNALKKEAADVLIALEHGDAAQVALWRRTGQWSLDEFKSIYKWLDCRFDHDFTESEVSEPSRAVVAEWFAEGKLTKKDGAVIADLTPYNLGTCVLLKSDGAGLYATKDLALAKRKFEQYGVDKSIYVVDAAQSHHFEQVFKVLELCGYEQAKKCVHLPYGLVVLPSGRMSSRKGNVMLFSELRSTIEAVLNEKYNKTGTLTAESIRRVAVASIKYGMLNHDTAKDIVFEMDKWTNNTGNTGPYLMYAFARINSILVAREAYDGPKFDFVRALLGFAASTGIPFTAEDAKSFSNAESRFELSRFLEESDCGKAFAGAVDFNKYLTEPSERLVLLHMSRFWGVIEAALQSNNPSPVCDFGFGIAQAFSTWYESVRLTQVAPEALPTKVVFIKAVASMLERVLYVLGITSIERM
jgi:arginyl-tRNA synthetase